MSDEQQRHHEEYRSSPLFNLIVMVSVILAFTRRSLKPLGYGAGLFLLMKWIQYDDNQMYGAFRNRPNHKHPYKGKNRIRSTLSDEELLRMYTPQNAASPLAPAQPVPINSRAIPVPAINKTEATVFPSTQKPDQILLGQNVSVYDAPVAPSIDPFARKTLPHLTKADEKKLLYSVRDQQNVRGTIQASFQDQINQTNPKPAAINPAFQDIFGGGTAVGVDKFVSRPTQN